MMEQSRQHNKNLNIRIFETIKDEFSTDVEIVEPKKQK
jgi:hypothetical protein